MRASRVRSVVPAVVDGVMRSQRLKRLVPVVVTAIAATAFVVAPQVPAFASCKAPGQAPLRFQKPVFIDRSLDGGEPTSVVAHDGSIVVGAHLGTTLIAPKTVPDPNWVENYRNQTLVWRSQNDGKTWQHIEIAPHTNMHSALSTGFSDPDFAVDRAGNLYGTEIDLANVAVFSSHDDGATWPQADAIADSGDRPWLAARGDGVVYERITGSLKKSTDGGQTWTSLNDDPKGYGQLMTDPTDPKGLFIPLDPSVGAGVDVSRDDGKTWKTYQVPGTTGMPHTAITSVGVDSRGYVYQGYLQGTSVLFSSWNPKTKQWARPVTVATTPKTTPLMWPWTVAGQNGRVAVGWYQLDPVKGQTNTYAIHVKAAVTENGRGSTVTCPDGSKQHVSPQFSVADAMGRAIYTGNVPCTGTGCNLTGDRRLGDFFTINFDRAGKLFVTTGDTTIAGPGGQVDTTSHPLFAVATPSSPTLTNGPVVPRPKLLRDAEAGRSALAAPKNNTCADHGSPSGTCEQPDTAIEPSVAVNPANPLNAVAAYQENRVDGGGDGDNGYAVTFDGGKHWTYGNLPGLTKDVGGPYDRASDAVVAFGPHNTVYADSLVFNDVTGNALESGIVNNVSTDGGKTWGPMQVVQDDQGAGLNDKNWIVVDNSSAAGHHLGRVYVVWDRVAGVFYRYSDDRGKTWSQLGVVYPGQGIGSFPMVEPNGDLAVVFDTLAYPLPQISSTNPDETQGELFSTSDRLVVAVAHGAGTVPTGAPLAFAAPTTVATYDGNGVAGQRAGSLPAATEDPRTGRIYVTWESGRYKTDGTNDVVVTASDDEGATWGPIVKVDRGTKADHVDHYNATVAVGNDGVVRIAYRQRSGSGPIDTVYQESRDNGLHFSAPLRVNSLRSDPAWGAYSRGGLFQGDYNQLATAGGLTYVVRCESYKPSLVPGDPVVSHRYHQTAWVAVVGSS